MPLRRLVLTAPLSRAAICSLSRVKSQLTQPPVVKTTVFLADINDFAAINEVYATYFEQPFPTRSCVAVKDLPKAVGIEIECICIKG